jgi:acyl-homoserine lactone acylase PvdQ
LENRNIDFYGVGKSNEKGIDEETRKYAQAYCDGINDFVKNTNFLPF